MARREPVDGPFLIAVLPAEGLAVMRNAEGSIPFLSPQTAPLGAVALSVPEDYTRHAEISASLWALSPADSRAVIRDLRKLADFLEANAGPKKPTPATSPGTGTAAGGNSSGHAEPAPVASDRS